MKSKFTTFILVLSVLLGLSFIAWLIINREDGELLPAITRRSLPDIEFAFAIGGDGSTSQYKMSEPMGVAISDNGDVYVADTLNNNIKVFNKKGKYKNSFGSKNEFYLPSDLAIDQDRLYVVDGKNFRIQVFNLDGTFIKTLAGPETGKEIGAWIPSSITISNNGYIYTTDIFYHRVIVFNKEGKVKNHFGLPGSGEGQLSYPNGIALSPAGTIYVADSNNNRIQLFDPEGNFLISLSSNSRNFVPAMPRGIAFGKGRFLYVSETFAHGIRIIDTENDPPANNILIGERGVGLGEMNFPNDVAVKNNVLCVADRANNRILVYTIKE